MALKIYTLPIITIASGGTAVPLSATSLLAASITIQADRNNVGRISIGDSTVTTSTGIGELGPGDPAVIEYSGNSRDSAEFDIKDIYVVSGSAGDIVRVSIMKRA
jgi:hypothetical protein